MEMHHIPTHHHPETATLQMDYTTVKHLLSEAEMNQQQQQINLAATESALLAAQSQHAAAKLAYDESSMKVERLKSQFREQIMEEGLRQSCRWNDMYFTLVAWKKEHDGDTTVPCDPKSSEEVKKLNRWVINQRTAYKYFMNGDKKHIKEHRIDALNKIGFIWSVTDQCWENNFDELRRHHAEHGSFDITHKQNRKLATFVSRLRTAMNHKKEGLVQQELTQEKIDRLNSINFTWQLKRKRRKSTTRDTVKFEVMYRHLVSFKEVYGHLKVNKLEKEWKKGTGKPEKKVFRRLPLFMAFCRKEQLIFAEGQPCALDEEKVQMLSDLGMEWKKPASEPRKSTGGETTRKKRKKLEEIGRDDGGFPAGFHYRVGHHPEAELEEHEDMARNAADAAIAAADAAMGHSELPPLIKQDDVAMEHSELPPVMKQEREMPEPEGRLNPSMPGPEGELDPPMSEPEEELNTPMPQPEEELHNPMPEPQGELIPPPMPKPGEELI
eukprot:CAMPEP_0172571052 /NCGR_PEP_ID=MMETSP1067-20121228/129878_1 /TAXON_ID=265564 ORGANISM="Thalassiosira punctigera, Strain Tpunct2005C2" /NCGR_SAMPLE_ID=MMETSP1067 /ASSEMBLY_ACC=CAM_ASM_000444 /LENGTH=495 /DNA_ID=CAMNT_0013363285 /DNA_START=27 /DNA_END=1514 /DNA_ORIENTATION=+